MKFSRLLVLSALCLTTTGAMAEIVNGVRQRPTATTETEWQLETTYYLYNVQARRFFLGGNDYNTRASIGPKGYKVRFHDAGDDAPEPGTVEIQDSVETQKAWKCVFSTADGGAIWVDNSTETYRFWNISMFESGTFRISNIHLASVVEDVQGCYLGWKGNEGDTRLYFVEPEEEDDAILWAFVSEENYQAYQETWSAMKDQFEKAAELLTYLNVAKEQQIDVAAEQGVYENEAATVEELEAAIGAVQKKINEKAAGNATAENPSDMTGSLLNPNFDGASNEGWKGTAPNMTGDGNHGPADVAEHYNKTFDTYQELKNMPAGVYMLENTGYLRGWWDDAVNHTNYTAFLYTIADGDTLQVAMANPWEIKNTEPMAGTTAFGTTASEASEEHDGVTYYAPNDPSAARLYFEKGYYKNKVFFAIADEGKVKLGVKKDVNRGNEWAVFDNFKLTFYGGAADAYQLWINEFKNSAIDYSDALVSEQYLNAYSAAFEQTASDKASVKKVMSDIQAANDSVALNVSLWKELETVVKEGVQISLNAAIPSAFKMALTDYIDMEHEDVFEMEADGTITSISVDYTNDQVRAEIEKVKGMIDDAKSGVEPGTDVTTTYLTNATLDNGSTGWTKATDSRPGVAFNEKIAEAYDTNFDLYQEVTKAPVGVYELQVKGFFRMERDQTAYDKYLGNTQTTDAGVYINENKSSLKCVFSEPYTASNEGFDEKKGGWWNTGDDYFPNDMASAAYAFSLNMFNNSAFGLVAKAGDPLRMGVKGDVRGANWICFDDFHLIYRGFAPEVVKPILEEKKTAMETTYVNEAPAMTKEAKDSLTAALANADAMLELDPKTAEDSLNIFNALNKLVSLTNELDRSIALCQEFQTLLDHLSNAISGATNPSLAQQASDKYDRLSASLVACELEEKTIKEETEIILQLIPQLRWPSEGDLANDENPRDVSVMINTPGFSEGEEIGMPTNSIYGWVAEGYNFGNDDTQKGALALEYYNKTFDLYQDITGLHEGIYEVAVNAFCRVGGIDEDYAAFTENNDTTEAYIYATGADSVTWTSPVPCLFKGAVPADEEGFGPGVSGESNAEKGGVTYYYPNDMVSAAAYFTMENTKYVASMLAKVGKDGKLRIGMKKEKNTANGWVLLDSWRLTYYGAASEKTPNEIADVVAGQPVSVEFFTIDGRRTHAMQKGITIQKTTMANGAVSVKKIIRK